MFQFVPTYLLYPTQTIKLPEIRV